MELIQKSEELFEAKSKELDLRCAGKYYLKLEDLCARDQDINVSQMVIDIIKNTLPELLGELLTFSCGIEYLHSRINTDAGEPCYAHLHAHWELRVNNVKAVEKFLKLDDKNWAKYLQNSINKNLTIRIKRLFNTNWEAKPQNISWEREYIAERIIRYPLKQYKSWTPEQQTFCKSHYKYNREFEVLMEIASGIFVENCRLYAAQKARALDNKAPCFWTEMLIWLRENHYTDYGDTLGPKSVALGIIRRHELKSRPISRHEVEKMLLLWKVQHIEGYDMVLAQQIINNTS